MRTTRRRLAGAESAVFAPPAAEDHPLKIVEFRAWRVKEPVSNRRYTVVRLRVAGRRIGLWRGRGRARRRNCRGAHCHDRPARDGIRIHSRSAASYALARSGGE